jgi:hypothetical protein
VTGPTAHDVAFALPAVMYTVGVKVTVTGALHSSPATGVGVLFPGAGAREREGRALASGLEGVLPYAWDEAAAGVAEGLGLSRPLLGRLRVRMGVSSFTALDEAATAAEEVIAAEEAAGVLLAPLAAADEEGLVPGAAVASHPAPVTTVASAGPD